MDCWNMEQSQWQGFNKTLGFEPGLLELEMGIEPTALIHKAIWSLSEGCSLSMGILQTSGHES